jgi:PAS domain S-box-containing protein
MQSFLRLNERLVQLMRWVILLMCLLIAFGLFLFKFDIFSSTSFHEPMLYVAMVGVTAVGLLQFFWKSESHTKSLLLVLSYHALAVIAFLFVTGYDTPFIFVWLIILIIVDTDFGRKAGLASRSFFFLTTVAWRLIDSAVPTDAYVEALLISAFICAGAFIISEIRLIAEERGTQLEIAREQEKIERERLLALINSMGDAVISTTEKGQVRIYNAAASALLDTNVDLIGKQITRVLKLRDKDKNPIKLLPLLQDLHGNIVRSDLRHEFSDGETISLYLNISPIHLGYQREGERGFIFLLRDITKEKSLEEERDEFISVVSHELRTPIAIAEGSLSNVILLQDRGADKSIITDSIKDAHEQILFLAKMTNDLSTLSRAERGVNLEIELVDIPALLEEARTDYEKQARERNLKLVIQTSGKFQPINTSKLYVQEILQNFVTNALKYTKTGSVTITAEMDRQHRLVLRIKDTGIGISKSDQKHLFEKFFRSEDYRTRESSGTGLGLYLVKKLAERLQAKITVESRLNHGSTFTILVPPMEQPQPTEAKPAAPSVPQK